MIRKIKYIVAFLMVIGSLQAQNIGDAVRYSQFEPIGTAATVGVGSALGALGGDFSGIGINPAGLAEYRKGAFTFTPSIANSSTEGYFIGDESTTNKRTHSAFGIDNIGLVSANNIGGSGLQTSNWSVGFSKLVDFNRNISLSGETVGSITERFIELANGKALDDLGGFEDGLAYDAGAIFQDASGAYMSDFRSDDVVAKSQFIDQRGSINELSLAWAGNFDNTFNFGVSASVPFVSFDETKTYREGIVDGDFSNNLQYVEQLNTTGAGFNMKLGLQYRAVKEFRVGLAVHSPTWYVLNDDFSNTMDYQFATASESFTGNAQSPDGSFKYRLNTPWKAIGSVASLYKIGDIKGFVTADVEFVDYRNNEFDFTAYSNDPSEGAFTQEVNSGIDNRLGSATNIRLGTELAYSQLRFRAGYGISTSPYVADTDKYTSWSAGVGFRQNSFFLDIGYRQRNNIEGYNPYVVLDQSGRDALTNIESDYGRIVATVGFFL